METFEDQGTGWAQAGMKSDFKKWLRERKAEAVSWFSETRMKSLKKEQVELAIWEGTSKQETELGHLD